MSRGSTPPAIFVFFFRFLIASVRLYLCKLIKISSIIVANYTYDSIYRCCKLINRATNSDEKEVVRKQLKYAPKRKGGEENQNL